MCVDDNESNGAVASHEPPQEDDGRADDECTPVVTSNLRKFTNCRFLDSTDGSLWPGHVVVDTSLGIIVDVHKDEVSSSGNK